MFTLRLGEILEGNNVDIMNNEFPPNSIDLVVTSPPYDDLRTYKGYIFKIKPTVKALYRVIKKGGVVVWVVGDATYDNSETGTSFKQALEFMKQGFKLFDTMIYEKNGFAFPSTNRYHQIFEYMFVFSKGEPKTFNPIKDRRNKTIGTHKRGKVTNVKGKKVQMKGSVNVEKYGMRTNIWKYQVGGNNSCTDKYGSEHPAIFPEKLAEDHIISWSSENDIVYDPFTGSGTTLKMAKLNKRKWIGTEISPEYCELARLRISEANIKKYETQNKRILAKKTKNLLEI